jgi:hypothetical protein
MLIIFQSNIKLCFCQKHLTWTKGKANRHRLPGQWLDCNPEKMRVTQKQIDQAELSHPDVGVGIKGLVCGT